MSVTTETIKQLADFAPRTYRHLNPRPLKVLTDQLLQLVGPEEQSVDARLLVAEYVADEVGSTPEGITGIRPEEFVAGILVKAGIATGKIQEPLSETGLTFPIVTLEGEQFVIDFKARQAVTPIGTWPGW